VDTLTQLGVGGIFVVLVLSKVADIIQATRERNGKPNGKGRPSTPCINALGKMSGEVHELYTWHAPNSDGRQTWKVPDLVPTLRSLDSAVSSLTTEMKALRSEAVVTAEAAVRAAVAAEKVVATGMMR